MLNLYFEIKIMAKIVTQNPQSFESFSFKTLTQCISSIHSTLQTSAVNAVNRYATIRNWLIGRYIIEYEQRGNDRAQYGARLLPNIVGRLKIKVINVTLLQNAIHQPIKVEGDVEVAVSNRIPRNGFVKLESKRFQDLQKWDQILFCNSC